MWPPQPGNTPTGSSLDLQFQSLNLQPASGAVSAPGYPTATSPAAGPSFNGAGYAEAYGSAPPQTATPGYPAPTGTGHYPSVPPPAAAAHQTYPGRYTAAAGTHPAPAAGYPASNTTPSGAESTGAGWTAEAVQTGHAAAPGQYGHYGNLQHAPSFNTAVVPGPAAAVPSAAQNSSTSAAYATPQAAATSEWMLQGKLPQQPSNQLIGPFVRFNDYEPLTGEYALSVLVVSHPSLASSTVQLHYAVNAPATQSAPSQILDDFMGE